MTQIPLISLDTPDADALGQALGDSFHRFGFAMVKDHGLDAQLVEKAWDLTERLYQQEDAEKRKFHDPAIGGARGYTPFKTEIAKGAAHHDLKEFWHIGRELPDGHRLAGSMPPNIWPDRPDGFRETFETLFADMDAVGARILTSIARYLDLPADWFDKAIEDGNSVLRLLHYPPIEGDPEGAIRAGAHEDINLITLLLGAEEAGLEILGKDGEWIAVDPPEGALVVNVGDMLQRLTNHVLPSTTHRVRNPSGERAHHHRYSMPFFLHARSDFAIETLPGCISADRPNRYPEPITADDYLQQRLREIGLIKA